MKSKPAYVFNYVAGWLVRKLLAEEKKKKREKEIIISNKNWSSWVILSGKM